MTDFAEKKLELSDKTDLNNTICGGGIGRR